VTPDNQTENLLARENITLSKAQTKKLIMLQSWFRGNKARVMVKEKK